MNFFEHQAAARRRTRLLTLQYLAAVLLLVPLTYVIVLGVAVPLRMARNFSIVWFTRFREWEPALHPGWWDARIFFWVTGAVVALIVGGTLVRMAQVARGGHGLIQRLGAVPVAPDTEDKKERRLLHVVEEMAIASGLPQPRVYRLPHQHGINAFTAGLSPDDAVVTVTQGCLDTLARDELQGVIAHEFSHITHGDTRFKTLLMGGLHGLVYPATVAGHILRQAGHAEPLYAAMAVFVFLVFGFLTVPLLLILQIWAVCAGLIKRMVSRQRELLADAAAVQYTRHPAGLAGAFKKVGGYSLGGRVLNWHAKEFGHLFFVEGEGRTTPDKAGFCSAHPPLNERIRRLDTDFDGAFEPVASRQARQARHAAAAQADDAAGTAFAVAPERIAPTIGAPGADHLVFAQAMRASLPAVLNRALHHPDQAAGVLYALLLSDDTEVRGKQMAHLKAHAPGAFHETVQARPWLNAAPSGRRLPIASMAVATLKQWTVEEYRAFRDNMNALIAADRNVSLFEYALRQTVLRHLGPAFGEPARRRAAPLRPARMRAHGRDLLSCLAYWGSFDLLDQDQAYRIGIEKLAPGESDAYPILPFEDCATERFGTALEALGGAVPGAKLLVIEACIACIAANQKTSPQEAECLQTIADALDCPLPPILPEPA